jgi:Tol biopolymer transport system component
MVTALAIAATAQSARAQGARPAKPAFATAIISSDSLTLIGASESPDGRWIAFSSSVRNGPTHVWLMPTGGGAPRRLTEGNHHDGIPVWFPSGRRIAFSSDRVSGIMVMDFDPVAGRRIGALKRVSIEDALWFDISPTGDRVVYKDSRNRVRVVPATGGAAVTILDYSTAGNPILANPKFSADGRDVFVTSRGQGGSTLPKLLRVPVTGGHVTTVHVGPADALFWGIVADPAKDRMILASDRGNAIATLSGDTIAVLPAQAGNMLTSFSRTGQRLLKGMTVNNSIVRLVPTSGGQPVDVTPGEAYDWPVAWSSDGMQVYSYVGDTTPARSKPGLLISSINGRARRFVGFAPLDTTVRWQHWRQAMVFGGGRYWAFVPRLAQPTVPLLLYDTQTRSTREVTRNAIRLLPAPAGVTTGSPEVVFLEKHGEGHEIRAIRGEGEPRTIHATTRLRAPWLLALRGDRIVLGEHVGDSTVLYVARGTGVEQRLASVAGKVTELAWSPDGSTLAAAFNAQRPGEDVKYGVAFMGITDQGQVTRAPWQVRTDVAWDLAWLPDSRAVILLEERGSTTITRVLRVPVDPRQPSTSLTPNERGSFWGQSPSPDGRWVAIPVERQGASTLWSIDVEAAAKAWRATRPNP